MLFLNNWCYSFYAILFRMCVLLLTARTEFENENEQRRVRCWSSLKIPSNHTCFSPRWRSLYANCWRGHFSMHIYGFFAYMTSSWRHGWCIKENKSRHKPLVKYLKVVVFVVTKCCFNYATRNVKMEYGISEFFRLRNPPTRSTMMALIINNFLRYPFWNRIEF